jgi:signal transduction histidine kinase
MRRRAERIGAALEVASDAHGTRVGLAYPLKPAQ